nr:uncharacterized protein CTRU02_02302 [Colletotrichum truncatum]KAF6798329.1 hypothetical protein CTRU02_02302 [Colletotrichum truncatum]
MRSRVMGAGPGPQEVNNYMKGCAGRLHLSRQIRAPIQQMYKHPSSAPTAGVATNSSVLWWASVRPRYERGSRRLGRVISYPHC